MTTTKKLPDPIAVTGIHSVAAILDERFDLVVKVWVEAGLNNTRVLALADKAQEQSIAVETVKRRKLDEEAYAHQGVLAWCRPPTYHNVDWLQQNIDSLPYLLLLDHITDCHNFGACLRSAEAAGISAVLVPQRHTSALNSGVAKSASGALYRVPLVQLHLPSALEQLKQQNYRVIGLSEHASDSIYQTPRKEKIILALGSEENGLSEAVISRCTQLTSIPCAGVNSSLNVSVAAGIAMFALTNTAS